MPPPLLRWPGSPVAEGFTLLSARQALVGMQATACGPSLPRSHSCRLDGNQIVATPVNLALVSAISGAIMKRIEKDGKFYRVRRGKLVEIPAEWVGEVAYPQTLRELSSKLIGKVARETKYADNHNRKDRSIEISGELAVEELKRKQA